MSFDARRMSSTYANPPSRPSLDLAGQELISANVVDSIRAADYAVAQKKWRKYANNAKLGPLFNKLLIGIMRQRPDDVPKFIELALTVDDLMSKAVEAHNAELFDDALEMYERVLAANQLVYGKDHERVAKVYMHMGSALENLGLGVEAIEKYEQALEMYESIHGLDHQVTLSLLNQLATLNISMSQFAPALDLLQKSLPAVKRLEGSTAESTADIIANMAVANKEMGNLSEAINLYEDALEIYKLRLGDHQKTADTLNNLAELFEINRDYAKALAVLEQALAVRESVFPAGHRSIVDTINSMAVIHYNQGNYQNSFELCNRAMAAMTSVCQDEHLPNVDFQSSADQMNEAGNHDEAFAIYQRALASYRKALGKLSRSLSQFRNNKSMAHLTDMSTYHTAVSLTVE